MTYVVTDACVDLKDKTCINECPVDCIYEGNRRVYINPSECIDCGACEPVCPVNAIAYEADLSVEQQHLSQLQWEVFESLPGLAGARRHGPLNLDHPTVAAMPVDRS